MRRTATSPSTDGCRPTRKEGTCGMRRTAPDRATGYAARAEGHEPGTGGAKGSPKIPADRDPGVNRGFTMFGEDDGMPWAMVGIRPPAPSAERSEAGQPVDGAEPSEAGAAGRAERSEAGRPAGGVERNEAGQAKLTGWRGDGQGPGGAGRATRHWRGWRPR
jgi:hypothetical protein